MQTFFKSLFVAGVLGSSALMGVPSSASAEAGALFSRLQENGAETSYAPGRGLRGGGIRTGGRAIGGRGIGGRGFGNRGFAGRGFGNRGFAGRRGLGNRGFAGRGGFGNRGFAGRGYGRPGYGYGYGYRRPGIGAGAVVGGLAAGALLGGAVAAQAAPGPGYDVGGDTVAYCTQRFKSYDAASGTYLGYDGQRHPCP